MRRFKDTEKSREGIPGFGTRLNKILEIGVEYGIWEIGCNEGGWTGWEEDHSVGWIRHSAGVDCLEDLRAKRSLRLVQTGNIFCWWMGLEKFLPTGLPSLAGAAMAKGCHVPCPFPLTGVAV